jgi:hypothetical protein
VTRWFITAMAIVLMGAPSVYSRVPEDMQEIVDPIALSGRGYSCDDEGIRHALRDGVEKRDALLLYDSVHFALKQPKPNTMREYIKDLYKAICRNESMRAFQLILVEGILELGQPLREEMNDYLALWWKQLSSPGPKRAEVKATPGAFYAHESDDAAALYGLSYARRAFDVDTFPCLLALLLGDRYLNEPALNSICYDLRTGYGDRLGTDVLAAILKARSESGEVLAFITSVMKERGTNVGSLKAEDVDVGTIRKRLNLDTYQPSVPGGINAAHEWTRY